MPVISYAYRIGLLVCTVILAACSSSAADLYDDYLSRLNNVLEVPAPDWQPPPPAPHPSTREMRIDIPDLRVNPLAYWNVRHCPLFNLVSERNSILGRVATPNAMWYYEARLLHGIEQCLSHHGTDNEQRELLREWRTQKRATWPAATWNGTLAAPELRQLWRASSTGWGPDQVPSMVTLSQDLSILRHWYEDWSNPEADEAFPVTREAFNAVYQRLGRYNTGGEWRRSVQISISGLAAANTQLRRAVVENNLCPSGALTQRGEYAQNVLRLIYIGRVQPYLADLNRTGETLLADLTALTQSIGLRHETWLGFQHHLQKELDHLQTLSRDHAGYWQTLLEQCGLTPGGQPQ